MCEMTHTVPKNILCNIVMSGRNYKQPVCLQWETGLKMENYTVIKEGGNKKKKRGRKCSMSWYGKIVLNIKRKEQGAELCIKWYVHKRGVTKRLIPWTRAWQSTPVFLPGESHGQSSLVGYGPQGHSVRHEWCDLAHMHACRGLYLYILKTSFERMPIS